MVKKKGKDHTHAARDTDIQGPHSIILEVQHWTAELSTGQMELNVGFQMKKTH